MLRYHYHHPTSKRRMWNHFSRPFSPITERGLLQFFLLRILVRHIAESDVNSTHCFNRSFLRSNGDDNLKKSRTCHLNSVLRYLNFLFSGGQFKRPEWTLGLSVQMVQSRVIYVSYFIIYINILGTIDCHQCLHTVKGRLVNSFLS